MAPAACGDCLGRVVQQARQSWSRPVARLSPPPPLANPLPTATQQEHFRDDERGKRAAFYFLPVRGCCLRVCVAARSRRRAQGWVAAEQPYHPLLIGIHCCSRPVAARACNPACAVALFFLLQIPASWPCDLSCPWERAETRRCRPLPTAPAFLFPSLCRPQAHARVSLRRGLAAAPPADHPLGEHRLHRAGGETVDELPPLERLLRCENAAAHTPIADALWGAASDADAEAALLRLAAEGLAGWEEELRAGSDRGSGRDDDRAEG